MSLGNEVGQHVRSVKTASSAACQPTGIVGLSFHDLRRQPVDHVALLDHDEERAASGDGPSRGAAHHDVSCCEQGGFRGKFTEVARHEKPREVAAVAALTTPRAEVAQLVEHVTENHGVGSSILPLGTTLY